MSSWSKAMAENEFTDKVKLVVLEGRRIALFKLEDGIFAIDDECSHANASLSEGEIYNHHVECSQHGARFDIRTGKNLSFPAVTPVRSYPVKVEHGIVYVQLDK